MNLIDVLIIIVIGFFVAKAIYKGFLNTAFGAAALLAAVLLSALFSPILSRILINNKGISDAMVLYIDAAGDLGSVENERLEVEKITSNELNTIVDAANYPLPFGNIIKSNVRNLSFAKEGLTTLGQYTNKTISYALLNAISFLILFLVFYLLSRFAINVYDKSKGFYVLKKYETLGAGLAGGLLGILFISVLFIAVPFALVILDVSRVTQYVNSSLLGNLFSKVNLFMLFIKGVL